MAMLSLALLVIVSCHRQIDFESIITSSLTKAQEKLAEACQQERVCRSGRLVTEKPDGKGGCLKNTITCEYGCSSVENGDDVCNPKPPPPVCNTQPYCKNDQMVYEELDVDSNTCIEKVQETCSYGCTTDACDPEPECSSEVTYKHNEIWGEVYNKDTSACEEVFIERCIFGISEDGTCNTEKTVSPFPDHGWQEPFRGLYDLADMARKTEKDLRVAVNDYLGNWHGDGMQEYLRSMNIPDEKMIFNHPDYNYGDIIYDPATGDSVSHQDFESFFVFDDLYPEADKIRAVSYPYSFPVIYPWDLERVLLFLENTNALHFVAAGNDGEIGKWDPENYEYYTWGGESDIESARIIFELALRTLDTGKVFIVRTGVRNPDGTVTPAETTVNCNDAAYACFTTVWDHAEYSSGASTQMAGLAYYLSHLFDKAEDVAEVLKACSDDLGEPGVDRVFGLGVPNMDCDIVRNAEVKVASAKITMQPASSHALDRMLSNKSLSFFYSASRTIKTGHVGKSVYLDKKTDLVLLGGRERTPLGVRTESQNSSFFELGVKRYVRRNVTTLFTYGQLWDKSMSAKVARIGSRYTTQGERYNLSVYTGYYHLFGKYGFPSRKLINRERIPFNLGSTEVKTSFFFRF